MPTYNELGNLEAFVSEVRSRLPEGDILIIDDNSPMTARANSPSASQAKTHRCTSCTADKEGLGRAYLAGFAWALDREYSHIFEIAADFSHSPSDLPRCWPQPRTQDIALGSRWIPGGGVSGWPLRRLLLSRGGNLYARLILGVPYRDLTRLQCFTRHALLNLGLDRVRSVGYGFQIETTWRALQAGLSVTEVPIHFTDRTIGESKMSGQTFKEALTLVWRLRLGR